MEAAVDELIAEARRLLADVYKPEGVAIWLHGRKRSLGERRPIDLLREGEHEAVFAAIERLRAGTPS